MPNKPDLQRLDEAMAHIRMNPELHDQGSWRNPDGSCGTTMCLAGWICELEGTATWIGRDDLLANHDDHPGDRARIFDPKDPNFGASIVCPADRAQRLLGIDDQWTNVLFWDCETLDELEEAVKDLHNETRVQEQVA